MRTPARWILSGAMTAIMTCSASAMSGQAHARGGAGRYIGASTTLAFVKAGRR